MPDEGKNQIENLFLSKLSSSGSVHWRTKVERRTAVIIFRQKFDQTLSKFLLDQCHCASSESTAGHSTTVNPWMTDG